jgi:hypothetical protein
MMVDDLAAGLEMRAYSTFSHNIKLRRPGEHESVSRVRVALIMRVTAGQLRQTDWLICWTDKTSSPYFRRSDRRR